MTTLIVTDTSCLIALDRVGRLSLLPALFTMFAPPAVIAEFGRKPGWLTEHAVRDGARLADLKRQVDPGQAEAIALALETPGASLLIDEARGRRVARQLGLTVVGTVGVLLEAKRQHHLDAVRPVLDALVEEHDFRLSAKLYRDVLRVAGET